MGTLNPFGFGVALAVPQQVGVLRIYLVSQALLALHLFQVGLLQGVFLAAIQRLHVQKLCGVHQPVLALTRFDCFIRRLEASLVILEPAGQQLDGLDAASSDFLLDVKVARILSTPILERNVVSLQRVRWLGVVIWELEPSLEP